MIYKLSMLIDEGEDSYLKDIYLDMNGCIGFYVPEVDDEHLAVADAYVSILHGGYEFTVKQEPHIIHYLNEKFVKKAIDINSKNVIIR